MWLLSVSEAWDGEGWDTRRSDYEDLELQHLTRHRSCLFSAISSCAPVPDSGSAQGAVFIPPMSLFINLHFYVLALLFVAAEKSSVTSPYHSQSVNTCGKWGHEIFPSYPRQIDVDT